MSKTGESSLTPGSIQISPRELTRSQGELARSSLENGGPVTERRRIVGKRTIISRAPLVLPDHVDSASVPESLNEAGLLEVLEPSEGDTKKRRVESFDESVDWCQKERSTTKWIDRVEKDDDGREFVRCRPAASSIKPRRDCPRDDLFAAMPLLEAKKALFAYVPRCARRDENRARTKKLMFIDVKKTHFITKFVDGERVALPDEFKKCRKYAKLKRCLYGRMTTQGGWCMTFSNVAEQLQRYSTIPRLTSVLLCVATTSLSQPRSPS